MTERAGYRFSHMPDVPPIVPGPLPPTPRVRNFRILQGMLIHGAIVGLTCFVIPIVMGSNIWPIAGVFWSVMTVPVALGIGALTGWLLKNRPSGIAIPVFIGTGVALAALAAVIVANNR